MILAGIAPVLLGLNAMAATFTWDGSGGDPLNDGAGNWNATGGTNWFDNTALTYGAWGNALTDTAIFGTGSGTAGTITAGTVNVGAITFNAAGSGNYTLSGGTITMGGTPTITTHADATISSTLASSLLLTKSGAGKLTLSGSNSSLTGGITVSAGALQLNTAAAAGTGTITLGDLGTGTSTTQLTLGNSATDTGFARNITVAASGTGTATIKVADIGTGSSGAGTITLNRAATLDGTAITNSYYVSQRGLSGTGALTYAGAAGKRYIMVTNSSAFTGDITVQSGILEPRNMLNTTTGSNMTVNGGAELRTDGGSLTVNALNGAGTVQAVNFGASTLIVGQNSGSGSFSGTMQSAGQTLSLTKNGTGAQELSGANIKYTGTTTLTQGTLKLTKASGFASTVGVSALNTATLQLDSPLAADSWTFNRQINGGSTSAMIEKTGSGTVILSPAASSSFVGSATGALTVTGGKLYLNTAFTTAPVVSVAGGATFGGTSTAGNVKVLNTGTIEGGSSGTGTLTVGNLVIGNSSTDTATIKGALSNTSGYKALAVTNLTLNGGNQTVTLDATGTGLTNATYYDLLVSTNAITAPNATSVLDVFKSNSRAYTPAVSGGNKVQLYYDATATVYWTGANSTAWNTTTTNFKLSGTNGNTQFLANDVVFFHDSPANSTVDVSGADVSPLAVTFDGDTTAYTLQGTHGIAAGTLTKSGGATLTIANTNTTTGAVALNGGVTSISQSGGLGSGALSLGGGTLQYTGASTSWNRSVTLNTGGGTVDVSNATTTLTESGPIGGGGGLTKSGDGTLALTGSNNYGGGTIVNDGTLQAGWTTSTLGGGTNPTVAVNNGGTLTITGGVEIKNEAVITLATGSTLNLSSHGQGNGLLYKAVQVTGDTTINLAHTGTTAGSRGNGFILNSTVPVNVTVNGYTTGDSFGAGWMIGGAFFGIGATESGSLATGSTVTFNGSGNAADVNLTLGWTAQGRTALANADLIIGNTASTAGVNVSLAGASGGTTELGSLAGGTSALTTIVSDNAASTLQINHGTTAGADFAGVINNGIGGSVSLVKKGTGTQILSGANTYTGATTVSAGTLLVNGSLGFTAVTVEATGTIGGSGELGGALYFASGANLSVNLADPLMVTGPVSFGGFDFADLTGFNVDSVGEGEYTVLEGANMDFTNVAHFGLGNAYTRPDGKLAYFDSGSLKVLVVPEASVSLLGLLGAVALLRRRRI